MKFDAWPVDPPGLGSGPLSSSTMSRQPRRPSLFRQLVPLDAVAHLRPKLPLERFWLRLDSPPQLVQARADQLAVHVKLVEGISKLCGVDLQGSIETPVLRRDSRDIAGVDDLVPPARLDWVIEHERDQVDQVLTVHLIDLQLAQEQI